MRQIREFRSNFKNISRDCRAIVARLSHGSRATFYRVSHDFPANVSYFHLIRTTVTRYSCECRTTFVRMSLRMSLSFVFSPDSREVFACCLRTVARPSCDTRTTFIRVSQKIRIVISPKFLFDRFSTLISNGNNSKIHKQDVNDTLSHCAL